MRRLPLLAALLVSLVCGTAQAVPFSPATYLNPNDTGISATGLNTAPSFTARTEGFGALTVYVAITQSAATSLTMNCVAGPNNMVMAPVAVANVGSSGAIAMANAAWTYPISSSGTYRMMVAPINDRYVTCSFGGAGATSSDLISVHARMGGVP